MIIEDTFVIEAPIQEVWDFFFDLPRMSACMPGVERLEQVAENRYEGALKVKVGPIAATFGGAVEVVEQQAPTLLKATARGKDRATASLVQGEFVSTLARRDASQTEVVYRMDVTIRGRLGSFGQAVIQETARQLSAEFVRCVKARIERPADPLPPARAGVVGAAARAVASASREALNEKARAVTRWVRRDEEAGIPSGEEPGPAEEEAGGV